MALGLFIAMLPLMGLQMPLAIVCAELARRLLRLKLSRVAAAAGVWLANPLTAAPLYGLTYAVGLPLTRMPGPSALQVASALFIGGVLLGVPVAAVGYWVTLSLIRRYQSRRAERRAQTTRERSPLPA